MKPLVIVKDLCRLHYHKAIELQNIASRELLDSLYLKGEKATRNTLFLCEHNPVYTVGIRRNTYTNENKNRLESLGADFVLTNRGGLITFHGPGQLIVYPVLYIGSFSLRKSIKWYVNQLEACCIHLCQKYGLNATTTTDTGVWIENRKIAAIGVHARRYVTTHGIALNCNVDLEWFKHIDPCGIPDKEVTSLTKELGREVSVDETKEKFLNSFEETFQCSLIEECTF